MKIQRETKLREANQIAILGFQEVPFEIRLNSKVQTSHRKESQHQVAPPVDHQAAIQASALIRQLFLSQPEDTVKTQANVNRRKVALLLAE